MRPVQQMRLLAGMYEVPYIARNCSRAMSRITPSALELVKQRFYLRGESVADWARAHRFDERHVYSVLSGRSKATRGQAHLIAVELGLKPRLAEGPEEPAGREVGVSS